MRKIIIITLGILLLFSCKTTRVNTLYGEVINEEKIYKLCGKPDTINYIILWNNDTISEKEFNRRWDRAINKTFRKIKKNL